MRILMTGISGFVGSHVLSHLLKNTNHEIIGIASWKHKGLPSRILDDLNYQKNKNRVTIITHDLNSLITEDIKEKIGEVDYILHIASGSHVDRSISNPVDFIQNNITLELSILEFARQCKNLKGFLAFSTDEVYGQAQPGENHKEWDPIVPSNPYSASKAAQEAIAISYWRTYSLPLIITNTMNIFGERQDKEKFIPLCIDKINKGEEIQIHGYPDGKTAGSRFYIHARNVADAINYIMDNVKPLMYPEFTKPERFNIVGEIEMDNLSLAKMIAKIEGKPLKYKIVSFHATRPGHDCRYALDGSKLLTRGWKPKVTFKDSLKRVVEFQLEEDKVTNGK